MIGIDAGNSLDQPPTGVAVYARNLIRELAVAHPEEQFAWFYRSNRYLRSFRQRLPANATRRLLEAVALGHRTRRLRLFHGLNQRLPEAVSAPRVATFHDLFALSGNYSERAYRVRFARLARETAARADHVIAVSRHTANQVADLLGFPRNCISVVHHGAEVLDVPEASQRVRVLARLGVQRPFVLHIGALQVRKNVERIVAAHEAAGEGSQLVLAGSRGFGARGILERVDRSPARGRIVLTGHVDSVSRACLYADAEALLFPSLEEGFGLPVVEAFSVGLPVIAANTSALPEVVGDAGILVDPLDTNELAEALRRVLHDPDLRSTLRARGLARARTFTWQRCARETWGVYQQVLARSGQV